MLIPIDHSKLDNTVSSEDVVLEVRAPNHRKTFGPRAPFWIAVQRIEQHAVDAHTQTVFEASIKLYYKVLSGPTKGFRQQYDGFFEGGYDQIINAVSLTTSQMYGGAVFLDPESIRGYRIGTYLQNEIVKWTKQWPKARVKTVTLLSNQAKNTDERLRRNRFYEQFGVHFIYDDAQLSGTSKPMTAAQLNETQAWKSNIKLHQTHGLLGETLDKNFYLKTHKTQLEKSIVAHSKQPRFFGGGLRRLFCGT